MKLRDLNHTCFSMETELKRYLEKVCSLRQLAACVGVEVKKQQERNLIGVFDELGKY